MIDFFNFTNHFINSRLSPDPCHNGVMKTKIRTRNHQPQAAAPRFKVFCLLVGILLLAATGCKPGAATNANIDPTGDYTLVSVDGKNVPCDVVHEGVTLTVKSGDFTITSDGHCVSHMNFSVPQHGDMSREVKAAYTRQGAELTMEWERAGTTSGNVHGNTFTMTNEDMVLAYRK